MSSSATSFNDRNGSIDFDFFENEDCQTKVYSKQKQSDSSKIITKAVIETKPNLLHFSESSADRKIGRHLNSPSEERLSHYRKPKDCQSSPSSSLEKTLLGLDDDAALDSLMNCLAYNDERFDSRVSSSPYSFDLKESSDNSLTDSSVTTITSELTSISPMFSSSLSSSSSCDSLSDDNDENSPEGESDQETEKPTDQSVLIEDIKQEQSGTNCEMLDELKETDESNSLKGSIRESNHEDQELESQDENITSPEPYESDFESYNETKNFEKNSEKGETVEKNSDKIDILSDKESHVSTLGDELGDISITQSRSSSSIKTSIKKRKNLNLTFSREELIRIERDNLILLKKIMAHAKHKPSVSLNQQPFCHKKTSTAINRAKLQKKIEQDNYILYSKISAMSRLKKVF